MINTLSSIKKTVEEITGFEFVKDTSRVVGVADARRIFCYLARSLMGFTYKEIGDFIYKDHSVVVYHVKKTENLLQVDKKFERLYRMCLKALPQINNEQQTSERYKYHLNQARFYWKKLKNNDY